jgi:uncharacterized protein YndB with AHSA1/START domain
VTAVGWVIDRLPLNDTYRRDRDGQSDGATPHRRPSAEAVKSEAPMVRVALDLVIARPIDDVFRRLTDLPDYSRWMPRLGVFIKSGRTSEGPVGVGATYYDRGWMGTFLGEIVAFHAPTRVAFKERLKWLGVTIMEARPQYELVATQTGTEVHHMAEGRLFGIFNVMTPLVAWMARSERGRTVRALKDSLEQGR